MNSFNCDFALKAYAKMQACYLEGNELNPSHSLIFPPELLHQITTCYPVESS